MPFILRRSLNRTIRFLISALLLSACVGFAQAQQNPRDNIENLTEQLVVYKHPLCFCCKKWIKHLEQNGLQTRSVNATDTAQVKTQWGVPNSMQSCHTAVWQNKYVFEGHVPARYIRQYLQNPPENSIGLTVPGMPSGSPGMYDGGEFSPYTIYLLQKDGDYRFFATVKTPD
jgi:hypothetical protein